MFPFCNDTKYLQYLAGEFTSSCFLSNSAEYYSLLSDEEFITFLEETNFFLTDVEQVPSYYNVGNLPVSQPHVLPMGNESDSLPVAHRVAEHEVISEPYMNIPAAIPVDPVLATNPFPSNSSYPSSEYPVYISNSQVPSYSGVQNGSSRQFVFEPPQTSFQPPSMMSYAPNPGQSHEPPFNQSLAKQTFGNSIVHPSRMSSQEIPQAQPVSQVQQAQEIPQAQPILQLPQIPQVQQSPQLQQIEQTLKDLHENVVNESLFSIPVKDMITHDLPNSIHIPLTSLPDITDEMQIRHVEYSKTKNEVNQLQITADLLRIKPEFPSAYFQKLISSDVSLLFVTSDEMTTRDKFIAHGKHAMKYHSQTSFLQQLYDTINPFAEPLTMSMLNALLSLFTSHAFYENITVYSLKRL